MEHVFARFKIVATASAIVIAISGINATGQDAPLPADPAAKMTAKQWGIYGRDVRRFRVVTLAMINRVSNRCTVGRPSPLRFSQCMESTYAMYRHQINGIQRRAEAIGETRTGRCEVAVDGLSAAYDAVATHAQRVADGAASLDERMIRSGMSAIPAQLARTLARQKAVVRECRP